MTITQATAGYLPTLTEAIDYASMVGVDEQTAAQSHKNIATGSVKLLATSGKFASGKDTVALAVMGSLDALDLDHRSFAADLKSEMGAVFSVLRDAETIGQAVDEVALLQGVPRDAAALVVGLVWTQVRADESLTGYSRTTEIRTALQYWGTEVRRAQDELYWVKKAIAGAIKASAAGKSVIFTDLRYPNEEEACRKAGFFTVRLDISPETQAQRLWDRDGITPDPATMAHPSENALDNHPGFTLRFDNDGSLADAVGTVKQLWL